MTGLERITMHHHGAQLLDGLFIENRTGLDIVAAVRLEPDGKLTIVVSRREDRSAAGLILVRQ